MVVSVEPGTSSTGWMARESTDKVEVVFPDYVPGRTIVEVWEFAVGVNYSRRRTLELAARIGQRPLRVLVDSGSISNYIDARECVA